MLAERMIFLFFLAEIVILIKVLAVDVAVLV